MMTFFMSTTVMIIFLEHFIYDLTFLKTINITLFFCMCSRFIIASITHCSGLIHKPGNNVLFFHSECSHYESPTFILNNVSFIQL